MTENQTEAWSSAEDRRSTKPGVAFRQECHQGRTTSSDLRNGGQGFSLDDGNLNYGREYAFVPVSKQPTAVWVSCTILPEGAHRMDTQAIVRELEERRDRI